MRQDKTMIEWLQLIGLVLLGLIVGNMIRRLFSGKG